MIELEWYHYVIAIVGGVAAGGINTLAGIGSAITLTILTELIGLPGGAANATNRIGIVAHCVAGMGAYYRNGKLKLGRSWLIVSLMVLGALGGIAAAIWVSNEQFLWVFRFLMVFMLFVILVKPERWLRETDVTRKLPLWASVPLFLALGFYGGFIQMGMGIFFLGVMVLAARYSLVESNVIKITVSAIYTIIAVLIFQFKGMVSWPIGLTLAAGQGVGGYFTAQFASRHPQANFWAHRVLVVVVVAAIVQLFRIPAFLIGLFQG